ncbi:MAG: hypothetical protein CMJ64_16095 [Planctomycetaceae bacterium]|nr:hypothetical protein [Planctomycetaceae bacterium]
MNKLRLLALLAIGFASGPVSSALPADGPADSPSSTSAHRQVLDYKSKRLHVQTDLAPAEAEALYARLEETLKFAAKYWGRDPRGQIECYVVEDLDNWSDAELPHRLARVIVSGVGGATVPRAVGTGSRTRNVPTVFASSRPGVAEHEIVHAYCTQTFGSTGPEWYREGMAEMVVRGCTRESGVQCSREQFASLRIGKGTTVQQILSVGTTGRQISAALKLMMDDPAHDGHHVSSAAWTQRDSDNVVQARDEYLRSWAFCYMLLHNPNYAKRFRTLGKQFVTKQPRAFDEVFAAVRDEINFEYSFLLEHVAEGYRIDLCRWDWRTRFRPLDLGRSHKTRVVAARGFQASGLSVVAGARYTYQADGRWSMSADANDTDADGCVGNSGRLVGVVMDAFELSAPLLLGRHGSFEAPTSGRLYLRCNDPWNEVADNAGQIAVTFRSP